MGIALPGILFVNNILDIAKRVWNPIEQSLWICTNRHIYHLLNETETKLAWYSRILWSFVERVDGEHLEMSVKRLAGAWLRSQLRTIPNFVLTIVARDKNKFVERRTTAQQRTKNVVATRLNESLMNRHTPCRSWHESYASLCVSVSVEYRHTMVNTFWVVRTTTKILKKAMTKLRSTIHRVWIQTVRSEAKSVIALIMYLERVSLCIIRAKDVMIWVNPLWSVCRGFCGLIFPFSGTCGWSNKILSLIHLDEISVILAKLVLARHIISMS